MTCYFFFIAFNITLKQTCTWPNQSKVKGLDSMNCTNITKSSKITVYTFYIIFASDHTKIESSPLLFCCRSSKKFLWGSRGLIQTPSTALWGSREQVPCYTKPRKCQFFCIAPTTNLGSGVPSGNKYKQSKMLATQQIFLSTRDKV